MKFVIKCLKTNLLLLIYKPSDDKYDKYWRIIVKQSCLSHNEWVDDKQHCASAMVKHKIAWNYRKIIQQRVSDEYQLIHKWKLICATCGDIESKFTQKCMISPLKWIGHTKLITCSKNWSESLLIQKTNGQQNMLFWFKQLDWFTRDAFQKLVRSWFTFYIRKCDFVIIPRKELVIWLYQCSESSKETSRTWHSFMVAASCWSDGPTSDISQ